ncbi:alpha/beta hydrolase family protein [Gregarina niphandrodes]|uniref:Alpha/beta hydrolase family protein n=1 Tax=Gregarina niphandrodes TaxID=110365 RepID=A0A023B505_GRENI|nr:alpha/beta hydrolase family protein [Gregarina niphandrodes]EZG57847.1 alpha/beta hydrolase family protein [Gregarina niphandrodes]|eukprot:XP_011131013.1 alpha/beta hydrolase family protein [Gregarina niphandrodes]
MFRSEDETSSSRRAEEPADLPDMTRSAMLDFEDMFQTAEPGEAEDSHCLLFKQESSDEYGEENFGPTNDASDPAPEGDQSPPLDRSRPRSGTSLPTELETDWVTMEADRGTRLAATSLATVSGDAVSGDVVSGDVVSGDVVSGDVVSGDVVFGDAFEDMFVDTVGEVQGGEVMQWDELAGFAAEDVDAAEEEAYILTAPELAECEVDGGHGGWGSSPTDESKRLQVVREELLDEEGPGCGVLPAEVVTAEVAAEAAEECGRRRTQSVEITTANGETETLERRDAILRAVTEATSKVHLISLGAKLVSFMGLKNRLIRKSAFFPPSPESYRFVTLPPTATNALMKPPTSADKILAEECVLFLRTHGHKEGTTEAGSMLAALPACKLRVAAFRLRRVADGDMTTAALLLYKPIYKSEAVCDETRADMLTDLQLRPLLIFSHGNSIDIGYHLMSLVQLATRLHVNVLAYDYPEYGLSRGKLTEKNILKAFRVAYDFARQRLKVPRTMIFLYGQSVGSVPTCYGAGNPDQFNCCGVILHAPLASALRIVAPSTKKSISTSDVLDNNKRIGNCPWPILIIHGCHDDGVPPWHGCQLDRTARDISNASETSVSMFKEYVLPHVKTLAPSQGLVDMEMAWSNRVTLWLPEFANHNNIEILYKSEYFKRLRLFIAQYAGRFAFRKKGE